MASGLHLTSWASHDRIGSSMTLGPSNIKDHVRGDSDRIWWIMTGNTRVHWVNSTFFYFPAFELQQYECTITRRAIQFLCCSKYYFSKKTRHLLKIHNIYVIWRKIFPGVSFNFLNVVTTIKMGHSRSQTNVPQTSKINFKISCDGLNHA